MEFGRGNRAMQIRVDNFEVFVDGERIEQPLQRVLIILPALLFGVIVAAVALLVLLPALSLGLLILAGLVLLLLARLVAWLCLPFILPTLVALGLFRWLSRR